jgi:hypothetical protein
LTDNLSSQLFTIGRGRVSRLAVEVLDATLRETKTAVESLHQIAWTFAAVSGGMTLARRERFTGGCRCSHHTTGAMHG